MKTTSASFLFASLLMAAATLLRADPMEEIDLTTADDSAEERAKEARVSRTPDGYLDVMCDDATLANVLKQFRRVTRMNILSSDSTNLARRVSASLSHVPWCSALQAILGLGNFKMDERGGIWYVSEKTQEEQLCTTRYFVLKHASAADLANLFNGEEIGTSYEERNSIRSVKSTAANVDKGSDRKDKEVMSAIAGKAKATAFPNTNLLVLTGPEANLFECEKIINELDRPVTQVYIEARFIELSTEALHKLGVQWDQLKSWGVTAKGVSAGYQSSDGKAADYGTVTSQKTLSNSSTEGKTSSSADSLSNSLSSDGTSSASSSKSVNDNDNYNKTSSDNSTLNGLVPTAIGDAVKAGATAADMGWRNASTFSGQLSAQDFNLALSAFEQMQEGKLFSNPRIIVSNGKEARVDMTTKEPNVEVTSDRTGTEGQNLSISTKLETIPGTDKNLFAGEAFFSYGITLSVKPRVSPAGLISVEVVPTISELHGSTHSENYKVVQGGDGVYTEYPRIDIKTINTEFMMKDGATAVIGGLTQTKEADVDSGIPYLRKIPWIGPRLFGWQSRQKVQNEILVLVTVGIANPETLRKDAGLPTNAVLGREYVEGRRLEPGERPKALENLTKIDTRTLDQIRKDPYEMDEEIDLEKPSKSSTNETSSAAKSVQELMDELKSAEPTTVSKPTPEPVAEKEPEPVQAPEPVAEKEPEPVQAPEPVAEKEPEPTASEEPEPAKEPEPAAEAKSNPSAPHNPGSRRH